MDDLIFRQAAIKEINRFLGYLDEDMLFRLSTAIKRLPPAQRWIPVTERLPEDNEAVNVVWINRSPAIYYQDIKDKPQSATGVYYKGQWYWWSDVIQDYLEEYGEWDFDKMNDAIEITHWMPLPEPPKEEPEQAAEIITGGGWQWRRVRPCAS